MGHSSTYAIGPETVIQSFAPGRIIVHPVSGISSEDFISTLAQHNGVSMGVIGSLPAHIVQVDEGTEQQVVTALSTHPHIQYVELDVAMEANTFTPNDPYYSEQWHLAKINCPTAWDISKGNGIIIGIVDSGVDGTHPDLINNLVPGYNFYDNNTNTSGVTVHGTTVAGVVAAVTNNGIGVAGVAGLSKIMPLRATDPNGYMYWSTAAAAITWGADHGCRIVNLSYAGSPTTWASSTLIAAGNYLQSKNGILFVSAGNTGLVDESAPTSSMVVVSATDQNDALCSFSTFGPGLTCSAPGVGIITTARVVDGSYWNCWGTSYASPITGAVVALMMSVNPNLTVAQYISILKSTAVDLGTTGFDQSFGYGRVNADAAVIAAQEATNTPPPDTIPPTVWISGLTAGQMVSGKINVTVNATDNVGVVSVALAVGATNIGTLTNGPYVFNWDTTATSDGNVILQAKATDAAGNIGYSNLAVTIHNTIVETAPTLSIVTPANDAVIPVNSHVTVQSSCVDVNGLSGVVQTLVIDGSLRSTVTSSNISYNWNTRKLKSGSHTIKVTATDPFGNKVTEEITVTS